MKDNNIEFKKLTSDDASSFVELVKETLGMTLEEEKISNMIKNARLIGIGAFKDAILKATLTTDPFKPNEWDEEFLTFSAYIWKPAMLPEISSQTLEEQLTSKLIEAIPRAEVLVITAKVPLNETERREMFKRLGFEEDREDKEKLVFIWV